MEGAAHRPAPTVDVDDRAHVGANHSRALQVPARAAWAPRAWPLGLPLLGCLPQGKVCRAALAGISCHPVPSVVALCLLRSGQQELRAQTEAQCSRGRMVLAHEQRSRWPGGAAGILILSGKHGNNGSVAGKWPGGEVQHSQPVQQSTGMLQSSRQQLRAGWSGGARTGFWPDRRP